MDIKRGKIPVYSIFCQKDYQPLSLGIIISYAKNYKNGILNSYYEFIPSFISSKEDTQRLIIQHGPGLLLSSNYVWNNKQNMEICKIVKDHYPETIAIHGGPSVPKYEYACEEYLRKNINVDIAVRGEGEITFRELIQNNSPVGILGLSYKLNGEQFHNPDRDLLDLKQIRQPVLFRSISRKSGVSSISSTALATPGTSPACTTWPKPHFCTTSLKISPSVAKIGNPVHR